MPHRRVILSPRPARRRPVPAYQVRRGARPAAGADDAVDHDDALPVADPVAQPDDIQPRTDTEAFDLVTPGEDGIPADATTELRLDTDASAREADVAADVAAGDVAAEPEAPAADVPAGDVAAEPEASTADVTDGDVAAEPEAPAADVTDGDVAAEPDEPAADAADGDVAAEPEHVAADEDYADVVRSVEEAAARDRGEVTAEPVVAAVDATAAAVASGEVTVLTPDDVRRQRAAVAGDGAAIPPEGGVAETHDQPHRRRWKRWLLALGIILALGVVATLGYVLYIALAINNAYDKAHVDPTPYTVYTVNELGTPVAVPTDQLAQFLPNWDQKDPVTLLLIGIDFRNGDEEPARSDSIILMRIDPTTKGVTMMSLPRDLLVTIPGHGEDKINAAFAFGEDARAGSGAALLAETVSYNLKIQINYFVTVDFSGFRKIIDTLGGITVDVNTPVKDDQYPTEDFGLTRVYFPTGLQSMDGEAALRYARTRHDDNDIARSERQQQVLMAMREKGSKLNVDLVLGARPIIDSMGDSFRTDLSFNQLLALANLARDVNPADIVRVNLWQEGALIEHDPEFDGDAFYMTLDWNIVGDLFSRYFPMKAAAASSPAVTTVEPTATATAAATASPIVPSGARLDTPITIRDDTSTNTGGAIAARILQDAGFTAVAQEMGVNIATSTTIYDYDSDPATAAAIAHHLGLDPSAVVPGTGGTGIVIIVGDDVVATHAP